MSVSISAVDSSLALNALRYLALISFFSGDTSPFVPSFIYVYLNVVLNILFI